MEKRHCSGCGEESEVEANFCSKCGGILTKKIAVHQNGGHENRNHKFSLIALIIAVIIFQILYYFFGKGSIIGSGIAGGVSVMAYFGVANIDDFNE